MIAVLTDRGVLVLIGLLVLAVLAVAVLGWIEDGRRDIEEGP